MLNIDRPAPTSEAPYVARTTHIQAFVIAISKIPVNHEHLQTPPLPPQHQQAPDAASATVEQEVWDPPHDLALRFRAAATARRFRDRRDATNITEDEFWGFWTDPRLYESDPKSESGSKK